MSAASDAADACERIINKLPTEYDRDQARRILKRRLAHPEYRANTTATEYVGPVHPRSTGDCAAARAPVLCARCNTPFSAHDEDGQRWDCEGWIAS